MLVEKVKECAKTLYADIYDMTKGLNGVLLHKRVEIGILQDGKRYILPFDCADELDDFNNGILQFRNYRTY